MFVDKKKSSCSLFTRYLRNKMSVHVHKLLIDDTTLKTSEMFS